MEKSSLPDVFRSARLSSSLDLGGKRLRTYVSEIGACPTCSGRRAGNIFRSFFAVVQWFLKMAGICCLVSAGLAPRGVAHNIDSHWEAIANPGCLAPSTWPSTTKLRRPPYSYVVEIFSVDTLMPMLTGLVGLCWPCWALSRFQFFRYRRQQGVCREMKPHLFEMPLCSGIKLLCFVASLISTNSF